VKTARISGRQAERLEKTPTDYQAQANRPFEHEVHLRELLACQAQLNAALELDKGDAQAAEPADPDSAPAQHRSAERRFPPNPYTRQKSAKSRHSAR
jgi:hypothetical protein